MSEVPPHELPVPGDGTHPAANSLAARVREREREKQAEEARIAREMDAAKARADGERQIVAAREKWAQALLDSGMSPGDVARHIAEREREMLGGAG